MEDNNNNKKTKEAPTSSVFMYRISRELIAVLIDNTLFSFSLPHLPKTVPILKIDSGRLYHSCCGMLIRKKIIIIILLLNIAMENLIPVL